MKQCEFYPSSVIRLRLMTPSPEGEGKSCIVSHPVELHRMILIYVNISTQQEWSFRNVQRQNSNERCDVPQNNVTAKIFLARSAPLRSAGKQHVPPPLRRNTSQFGKRRDAANADRSLKMCCGQMRRLGTRGASLGNGLFPLPSMARCLCARCRTQPRNALLGA